jgi:DNA-binding Lrp family transcriptional regulator
VDHDALDALDARLLHALQVDGRAPFSRIAEVIGAGDRTVARRYARLRSAGLARVVGVPAGEPAGTARWLVRLRVPPARCLPVARSLAGRADTAWVTVAAGGTEVLSVLRVPEARPAPLAGLGAYGPVTGADAYRVLHPFMGSRRWHGRTSALTEQEVAALRPPAAPAAPAGALTGADRDLLRILGSDGRAAFPDLARHLTSSQTAVRRRLAALRESGALGFDVEVDPRLFGAAVQCLLWLTTAPSRTTAVAEALAADPEAAFVATVTGAHTLVAIAVCRDVAALHTYLTARVPALDGVLSLSTTPVDAYAKRESPVRPPRVPVNAPGPRA